MFRLDLKGLCKSYEARLLIFKEDMRREEDHLQA